MISYDEFSRMELRVAVVLSAEAHPNADRLIVLKIDLGGEQRQIVAGLKPYYELDQLVGRKIVVVANLEPATLRGIESNGMLLAAQDGESVIFLTPERDIAPGAKVL